MCNIHTDTGKRVIRYILVLCDLGLNQWQVYTLILRASQYASVRTTTEHGKAINECNKKFLKKS